MNRILLLITFQILKTLLFLYNSFGDNWLSKYIIRRNTNKQMYYFAGTLMRFCEIFDKHLYAK